MKDALESFFEKRDCVLPYILFRSCFEIIWDGVWLLVPLLINFAFDNEIRAFRRSQALDLLIAFYKNHRLLTQNIETLQAKLTPFETKLNENTLSAFKNDTVDNSKGKFIGSLISLLHIIEKVHSQFEIKSDSLDYETIKSALLKLRNNVSFSKDAKKAFNKFVGCFKAQKPLTESVTGEKEESEQNVIMKESAENGDNSSRSKKAKKKKSKNKQEQRNSKKLRFEAMSEGIESLTFNGENLPSDEEADFSTENTQAEAENPAKQETENSSDLNNSISDSDGKENSSNLETNNCLKIKQNDKLNLNRKQKPNGLNKHQNSPNKKQNFNGPNGRHSFDGLNKMKSFDAPNKNRNFDSLSRRQHFNGPNEKQNGFNRKQNFKGKRRNEENDYVNSKKMRS